MGQWAERWTRPCSTRQTKLCIALVFTGAHSKNLIMFSEANQPAKPSSLPATVFIPTAATQKYWPNSVPFYKCTASSVVRFRCKKIGHAKKHYQNISKHDSLHLTPQKIYCMDSTVPTSPTGSEQKYTLHSTQSHPRCLHNILNMHAFFAHYLEKSFDYWQFCFLSLLRPP